MNALMADYVFTIIFFVIFLLNYSKTKSELDLIKKVFFKSDDIYWDNSYYSVCVSQTRGHTTSTKYCDFEQFKNDFLKFSEWEYDEFYDSLFGKDHKDPYIHAGVLYMNGYGYIPINEEEYKKIFIFIRSYIDVNFKGA